MAPPANLTPHRLGGGGSSGGGQALGCPGGGVGIHACVRTGRGAGRLAARAFGQYDLPIPRSSTTSLLIVPATVDAFAADWSLPQDEMRLWVLAQELIDHAVFSHDTVRAAITSLVQRHVGAFSPDPTSVSEKLATLEFDAARRNSEIVFTSESWNRVLSTAFDASIAPNNLRLGVRN